MKITTKQTGLALLKGAFGLVPFAGTAMNEMIDLRGNVKQERLNIFSKHLLDYLSEFKDVDFNVEYIKSDEFGDIFETIVKMVINNNSKDKIHRFKEVLTKEMFANDPEEFSVTFLDIIAKINEKQIEILNYFYNKHVFPMPPIFKPKNLSEEFQVDKGDYLFYIQDLISKSLLFENNSKASSKPFSNIYITEFGIKFIDYIKN